MKIRTLFPSIAIFSLVFIQIHGQDICGQLLSSHSPLITYGYATIHWPWHAAIYHRLDDSLPEYKCGGTVISSNLVVTAAHCVSRFNKPLRPSSLLVSLGKLNLEVVEPTAKSFEIAKIYPHPLYSTIDYKHDIAIIRLATYVTFDNYVRPVCLWPSNQLDLDVVIGKYGTVVGWGVTEKGNISSVLQQALMPVIEPNQCLESSRKFFGEFLTTTNFCAGYRNGTRTCFGDSGGSITFENNGRYFIRGVVSLGRSIVDKSTGQSVCDSLQYALFTDVAYYLPWISDVMNECEKETSCFRTLTHLNNFVCDIRLNFYTDAERKCKIIFNEISNRISWLEVFGYLGIIPDLTDAISKFPNLKVLQLTNTKLSLIERSKLSAFVKLKILYLDLNEFTELEYDTFNDLGNLEILVLNNNTLTQLHMDLFKGLPILKEIYLDGNRLVYLPDDIFRYNPNLREIGLERNMLRVIQRNLFQNLMDVKFIYLNDNYLETLPEGLFRNNKNLEKIGLRNNKLKAIESDFQNLVNIVEIDLRGNFCIDEHCVENDKAGDCGFRMQKKIEFFCQ